jgi:hypothetical protein
MANQILGEQQRAGRRKRRSAADPISQSAAESLSGRLDRDPTTGRLLPGHQVSRKYPRLPSVDDAAVAQRVAARRDEIIDDLGGRARLAAVKLAAVERFALLEMFAASWEQYFLRSGLMTRQGRVRSGYAAGYLATVGQLIRLGQIIGLDRVPREVAPLSPRQWLEQDATEHPELETKEASGTP